ncbi:MAG TPA: MMPL family transporter [Rectinemataceae bacterium]|nr:MMPL family transporter [Rectinemataceae bacterium]
MKRISMEKIFKHPRWIVAIVAVITIFFALQIPRAQLDNNNFRFIPDSDPERLMMKKMDATFGSQTIILVGLERKHGTIFDADFLKKVRAFSNEVGKIGIVESVTSIVSTDYITGVGDSIVAEPLVADDFAGTKEEIAELKDRLSSWELYSRALVSDDLSSTQILVNLNIPPEDAGKPEVVAVNKSIKSLAEQEGFADTNIYITGMPVFSSVINDATKNDLIFLVPLVVLVVVLVLFFSFRRLSGIVLPLLTVLISAIWAVGAMPLFGVKLSILSTLLPVILVAVGSAYGIHVVSHYFDEMAGKRNLNPSEHRALVFAVLRKIGQPVLLAALTTFAGFASFCFTKVIPIFEFGIFSSFGVLVAFVVAVTLIPALILIRGPVKKVPRFKTSEIEPGQEDPLSAAIADGLGHIIARKRATLFIACSIVFISLFGVSRLVIDNVLVEYFKPNTDIVKSDGFIRTQFGGSKSVSVVVSSETPGEVLRPDVLAAMDGLAAYLKEDVPEVGKTSGFTDIIKRINQVFNADESPDGLKPQTTAEAAAGGAVAAGSGGDSGFGFGFADSGDSAPAIATPTAPAKTATNTTLPQGAAQSPAAEKLDALAMVALLNKAVSEGNTGTMSADELIKRLARSVNYRGAAYYEIPTDPARYGKKTLEELKGLISNYLVLVSGNVSSFADDPLEPKAIRMAVQLRTVGQIDTNKAINTMKEYIAERFPKDVKVEIGGDALVEKSLNNLVVQSQLSSVAVSLLMVFIILAIYYRSAIAGLIGLAPLSISILINVAVMGFAGIKLNIGTAMVASISVGIGIDYTIHYMAAYHNEYLATGGKGDFLRRTFLTSGKAILFNAVSVGAGFAVLCLSQFIILADLGLLIALTMATSALVSLTVLPVLLIITNPAFIRRPLPSDKAKSSTEAAQ